MIIWRTALVLIFATIGLAGCSESFRDKLSEHRYCIGEAGILPAKIDTCMSNTNGHRSNVNRCLSDQMVPDRKIEALNDCVDSSEHHDRY
jgi:hypothetical protein